ncbi:MAG: hypothetical protein M0R06_15970 [Sphaerochaeta sp.]|jgi:hypothetical protein|nr:hypothetical protein [Sphaerochaeta sp.]
MSDRELDAMATAWTAIASLDDDARRRVCWWLSERTTTGNSKRGTVSDEKEGQQSE